jgi:hypothetical protein
MVLHFAAQRSIEAPIQEVLKFVFEMAERGRHGSPSASG